MERGGAAVSTAPLSSEGMPFGSTGGELFAVGFSGGTVALYDARCQCADGLVAGFVTRHRWLERVRAAGPLLMASYGRWGTYCGEGQGMDGWAVHYLLARHCVAVILTLRG